MSGPLRTDWIAERVELSEYVFTRHAQEERLKDWLSIWEVEEALRNGVIIENYPDDPRGPSCLTLGRTGDRDVHIVCGRNTAGWLVIITVYLPSLPKWRTPRERNLS